MINKLNYPGLSWKMNLILGLFYYYDKDDKVIAKEMFSWSAYGIITIEIDKYYFIPEIILTILIMVKSWYVHLEKMSVNYLLNTER